MREQVNKVTVDLMSGEALMVGSIEFWDGLVDVCTTLASEYEPSAPEYVGWMQVIDDIKFQTTMTLFVAEEEDEEEI